MTKNWQDLQGRVVAWRNSVLREKGVTLEGTLKHLVEEAQDLEKNPYDPLSIADMFILLLGVCDEVGFSAEEVLLAVDAKMCVNEARVWREADSDGIVRHLEETRI